MIGPEGGAAGPAREVPAGRRRGWFPAPPGALREQHRDNQPAREAQKSTPPSTPPAGSPKLAPGMAGIVLENVSKDFVGPRGRTVPAIRSLNLAIAGGELLAVVGPSGCGKTTLLRLIAGLETPSAGRIQMDDRDLAGVPPAARGVGFVFQSGALYPHLSAFENLALGLRLRGVARSEIDTRVREVSSLLGLAPMLERRPGELSGGERQRVALGRALINRPRVLLLDEPLAALDAPLRAQLRREIARVHRELGGLWLHVTHDQAEALSLGDRVAVLCAGALQQVAPPRELYERPANVFVAGFIGSPPMNLIPGTLTSRDGHWQFTAAEGRPGRPWTLPGALAARWADRGGRSITLGLRPEHIVLGGADAESAGDTLGALVELVEPLGADGACLHLDVEGCRLVAQVAGVTVPRPGERITATLRLDRAHAFDGATGQAL